MLTRVGSIRPPPDRHETCSQLTFAPFLLPLQATDMKQHFSLLSLFNTKLLPALSSPAMDSSPPRLPSRSSIDAGAGGAPLASSHRSSSRLLTAGSRSSIDAGVVSASGSSSSRMPKSSLDDEQCSLVLQVRDGSCNCSTCMCAHTHDISTFSYRYMVFHTTASVFPHICPSQSYPPPDTFAPHIASLSLQLCIKCADLSSLGAANGVYRKWVYRLEDEVRGSLERTEALA